MDGDDVLPGMDAADFPDLYDPTAPGADQLASVLSELRAPARPAELERAGVVMAAFAARSAAKEKTVAKEKTLAERGADEDIVAKEKDAPKREPRRRDNVIHLPRHLGPKLGVATAAALIGLTGVAAAAVTGSLPAPLQSFVHSKIGAIAGPSAHPATTAAAHAAAPTGARSSAKPSTDPSSSSPVPVPAPVPGVGPAATRSAAAGLCHALAAHEHGRSEWLGSLAGRNLAAAAAAGGETVDAYCSAYVGSGSGPGKGSGSKGSGSANGRPGHGRYSTPAPTGPSGGDNGSGSSGSGSTSGTGSADSGHVHHL